MEPGLHFGRGAKFLHGVTGGVDDPIKALIGINGIKIKIKMMCKAG